MAAVTSVPSPPEAQKASISNEDSLMVSVAKAKFYLVALWVCLVTRCLHYAPVCWLNRGETRAERRFAYQVNLEYDKADSNFRYTRDSLLGSHRIRETFSELRLRMTS